MKEKYYLLDNDIIVKNTVDGDYFYNDGHWIPDNKHKIADCLIGFDSSEEPDSPYAIGNTEMLNRIEPITKKQAEECIDSCQKKTKEQNTDESEKKTGFEAIKDGSTCFLVIDPDGNKMWDSKFIKWLQSQGFISWGVKGHWGCSWVFVNMNSRVFAPGMPGVELAKSIGNHAITKDEFIQIYKIYEKYSGENPLVMK